jgi:dinuclear metal center YbgI/SA1388 family protein
MPTLRMITDFLDRELKISEFSDASNNGLQVQNSGQVDRIACSVDGSMESFEAAQARGADLVICHHGISWGDSLKQITGLNYQRVSYLVKHDMALYACHLPLDAHPVHGNNAQICKALGLQALKPFGLYGDTELGFEGKLPRTMSYEQFKRKVARTMGNEPDCMDFGKDKVRTVAVVSGGAAGEVDEAGRKGLDVYLSGEPALVAYSLAQEYGINAVFAGHYATETFGVRALGKLLTRRFKVPHTFIDLGIPF